MPCVIVDHRVQWFDLHTIASWLKYTQTIALPGQFLRKKNELELLFGRHAPELLHCCVYAHVLAERQYAAPRPCVGFDELHAIAKEK